MSRWGFLLSGGTALAPRADEARLPNHYFMVAGHSSFLWMVGFRKGRRLPINSTARLPGYSLGTGPAVPALADRTLRSENAVQPQRIPSTRPGVRCGGSATIRLRWSSDSSPHGWRDDPRVRELAWSCGRRLNPGSSARDNEGWAISLSRCRFLRQPATGRGYFRLHRTTAEHPCN